MIICSFCKKKSALPPCKTGLKRYLCRECHRQACRDYYNSHKKKCNASVRKRSKEKKRLINAAKEGPCVDCGKTFPPCVMDFDHLDPSTKIQRVSWMHRNSVKKIIAEIDKCELVCSNCHRLRTYNRTKRKKGTKLY